MLLQKMTKITRVKYSKLNLGCGKDTREGYVNLDSFKFLGVDVVHDLDKIPWPFADNSFGEIVMSHVLEHLNDIIGAMREIWRISKPNAIIKINVPHFSSLSAFSDPMHKHFFALRTFDFFERNKLKNYFNVYNDVNFKILKKRIIFSRNRILRVFNFLPNLNHTLYERFFAFRIPSQELEIVMEVIK